MTGAGRGRARVCGDCWSILRPDEYEPSGGLLAWAGRCSLCGGETFALHRVAWAEIDAAECQVRGWHWHANENRSVRHQCSYTGPHTEHAYTGHIAGQVISL